MHSTRHAFAGECKAHIESVHWQQLFTNKIDFQVAIDTEHTHVPEALTVNYALHSMLAYCIKVCTTCSSVQTSLHCADVHYKHATSNNSIYLMYLQNVV
jgi:hypothetical protein